jgi:prepilin-type processing-associated H-X9-DG protein
MESRSINPRDRHATLFRGFTLKRVGRDRHPVSWGYQKRHRNRSNTAFADGHVTALPKKTLFGKTEETLRMWNHDHEAHLKDMPSDLRALIH